MIELNKAVQKVAPKNQKPITVPDFDKPVFEAAIPQKLTAPVFQKSVKTRSEIQKEYAYKILFYTIFSSVILLTAFFVFRYAQDFVNQDVPAQEQKLVFENPLVRADKSRVISLEEGTSKESLRNIIIQAMLYEKVKPGEIAVIIPSYLRDTVVEGTRKLVSEVQRGDDFFFTFAVRATLSLRAISAEKYAIGVVGTDKTTKNFLAFSVSSAPDATREMQRWESEVYNDLKLLLKLRNIKGDLSFRDLSQNNHILRVGYDDDGVVMIYGFGAPKTIVVVPDTETFETIYNNLK